MGETTTGLAEGTAAMEGHCPDNTHDVFDDDDDVFDDDNDGDRRNKSSFDNGGGFSGGRLKTAGNSSDPALGSSKISSS